MDAKKYIQNDYYKTLKVGQHCTTNDVRQAYKTLAMKWHPLKNLINSEKAQLKFARISEAYEVLSNAHKRAIYNTYGEAGLKGQAPIVGTGTHGFSMGGNTNMFEFVPRMPEEVFAEFCGGTSPFDGMFGNPNPRAHKCLKPTLPNPPPKSTCALVVPTKTHLKKLAPITNLLPCTLEELTNGCVKKLKIARSLLDDNGQVVQTQEVLTIEVKPGWKKGTKIVFPEKGNQHPGMIPADMVFLIDEKPHPTFSRDGDNLISIQKINLADALVGCTVTLTTLDFRVLNIPCSNIIKPDFEKVVFKEGMPVLKEPGKKGNLIVRFDIKFPIKLTNEQKKIIKSCLGKDIY